MVPTNHIQLGRSDVAAWRLQAAKRAIRTQAGRTDS